MRIIKISAVWCPGCLVQKPIYKEIKKDYPQYNIEEYDYDMDEDVIEKYNVGDKLPVLIILDDNDKEIKRLTGEKKKEEILDFLGDL